MPDPCTNSVSAIPLASTRHYRAAMMRWLRMLLFSTLLMGSQSFAGDIVLVTALWDFICKVEVATGMFAPEEADSIEEFPGVRIDSVYQNGVVFIGKDRLCYRRSSVPDDCHSALNAWSCFTNPTDTTETLEIQ